MPEKETTVNSNENLLKLTATPIHRFFHIVYRLVLHPGTFYEQLPEESGYASAMGFLFSCSVLFGIFASIYTAQKKALFALIYFSNAFFMPFLTAFLLYLVSLIFCKNVFTYQALFGITAYANVALLAAWIPGPAWITGIWKFCLVGIGMVKVGRISGLKAFLSLLATAAILLLLIQLSQPIFKQ